MSGIGVSLTARPITAEPHPRVGAVEADDTTHRLNMGPVSIHITTETAAQWIATLAPIAATVTEEEK